MPEEGREVRQPHGRVHARAVPAEQRADGERMPKIVDARCASPWWDHEAQTRDQVITERVANRIGTDPSVAIEREERGL